jgi:hypothetical protein
MATTTKDKKPSPAAAVFAKLAEALSKDSRVDPPAVAGAKGFGSKGLKVARKMFAFESKDRLVVKLSAERVAALVSEKTGAGYDPGSGRLMKEWVAIDFAHKRSWMRLAKEALEHAAGRSR